MSLKMSSLLCKRNNLLCLYLVCTRVIIFIERYFQGDRCNERTCKIKMLVTI